MNETTARTRGALSLLLALLSVSASSAQTHTTQPKEAADRLTPASLSTRGLTSADILRNIFIGDFSSIDFDRSDPKFTGIFDQYLISYAHRFGESLPKNDRVMMTAPTCNGYSTTGTSPIYTTTPNGSPITLGGGTETHCSSPGTVDIGWAKPVLYSAKKNLDRQKAADSLRTVSVIMGTVLQSNGTGTSEMLAKLAAARAVADDIDGLVQQNGPAGPVLDRFEQNLLRFAANRPGLRLDGKSSPEASAASDISRRDQDFTRLITDLVEDDARNWGGFAKYVGGSITESTVRSTDTSGRPAEVAAGYAWDQMFGRAHGTVTLRFDEGMPNCFFYSETSSVCHPANRKIVAAYSQGAYAK